MEDKLDKIAEDVAYMRGKWDSTIPPLVNRVSVLEESKNKSDVSWGKITLVGSFVIFIVSSIVGFFTNVFANKVS